jgi:hypothetical protein
MNARTTPKMDAPRPLRARRRAEGLVAQYIHELSGRHAGTRHRSAALAGHIRTRRVAEQEPEAELAGAEPAYSEAA